MGKCNNCKYGKTAFEDGMNSIEGMTFLSKNPDSVLGAMYGTCMNGNIDTFVKWWKDAVGVPSSETKDVPCYEPTELSKHMDGMLGTLDKMLELVKVSNAFKPKNIIKFDDVELGDNVVVIGNPGDSLVTIQSTVREKDESSIILWWCGGEFGINKSDIETIYKIEDDLTLTTEQIVEQLNN